LSRVTRRKDVAVALDLWSRAAVVRREWLDAGLSAKPAERELAETAVARLYSRTGRDRPEFCWVESPRQALPLLGGIPGHVDLQHWLRPDEPPGRHPVAVDLATRWSGLLAALDNQADHPDLLAAGRPAPKEGWPQLPPRETLEAGAPLRLVLQRHLRGALWSALIGGVVTPVRAALGAPATLPISWYGQQDASWIAHYDALRRLGLADYPPLLARRLDDWATLARSTGWWWPGEHRCVMVERPVLLGPLLLSDEAPAVQTPPIAYADGWRVND
jgi:hypothetical protein